MAGTGPDAGNDYQVGPTATFSRIVWNAVMESIAARLKAREALEANFEALIGGGTQAALDMIQVNIGPQLAAISEQVSNLEAGIGELISGGVAPNALQLGGKNPSHYLALANATGTLPVAQVSGVQALIDVAITAIVNGSPATLDTLKELSDALGGDANFATSVAEALGQKAPLASAQLTGEPTAPTPASRDSTTRIATTEFVSGEISDRAISRDLLIGCIFDDASPLAAQPGFMWAEGQAVSRTTYAKLFARLGTQYGAGDGATTFNIPDLRARLTMGADGAGANATGRLGAYLTSNSVIGTVGGSPHLAAHNHTGSGSTSAAGDHSHWIDLSTSAGGDHQHWIGGGAWSSTFSHTVMGGPEHIVTGHAYDSGRLTDWGGNHAHNVSGGTYGNGNHAHSFNFTSSTAGTGNMGNLPPLMLVRKVIYTGVH